MIGANEDAAPGPLDAVEVAQGAFAPDGLLETSLGLRHRPGQAAMAEAVAQALHENVHVAVEAGTGTGKSLAYLVPALAFAASRGRPLVVSTHTIPLQQQLLQKDLPSCARLFAASGELPPLRFALLLGKANYLCGTRLRHALEAQAELFESPGRAELQRIAVWADRTQEGVRQELDPAPSPEVWDQVNADSSACNKRSCDPSTCFYQRARAQIRRAHAVVVNHSLLFSLLAAGADHERGVLFADDCVVLDEAHTLTEVATDHLGLALSSAGLDRLLKGLFNPRRNRGLLQRFGLPRDRDAVVRCIEAADAFWAAVDNRLLAVQPQVRLREPGLVPDNLDAPLLALHQTLGAVADRMQDGASHDEIKDQRERVGAWRAGLLELQTLADESVVHWVERAGRLGRNLVLRTAPIDVAPLLRDLLFRRGVPVVLTSATLAAGSGLDGFTASVGADGARALAVASPFDYAGRMRVAIATDMPQFTQEEKRGDAPWLAALVEAAVLAVPGGSLVLFTSHRDLRAVADLLGERLAAAGRRLLAQGEGAQRARLLEDLRTLGNAVLFGTDSFWTGIDVPGDALQQVVVTRLPFEFPRHPVAEARADAVRMRGGNPFQELTLPASIMQFRQGIGRLIRSVDDRGVLTVLDSRILTKAYGGLFLEGIPVRGYTRIDRASAAATIRGLVAGLPD